MSKEITLFSKRMRELSALILLFSLMQLSFAQSLRPITFTARDTTVVFDGASHTLQKWMITSGSLLPGDYVDVVTMDTTCIYPGSHTVNFKTLKIRDNSDNDVTGTYDISFLPGTLSIAHRTGEERFLIQLEPNSSTVTFDGLLHQVDGFTHTSFQFYGHTYQLSGLTAHAEGTYAGEYPTELSGTPMITYNGYDVTGSFRWTVETGKLLINKAPLVLSLDTTKTYDGDVFSVSYDKFLIASGYELVPGDAFTAGMVTTTGEEVNRYTDHNLGAVLTTPFETTYGIDNYIVNASYTLKIEPLRVIDTVRGEHYTGVYDGSTHSVTGYTFSANQPLYSQSNVETAATGEASRMLAGTSSMGLRPSQFSNTNDNFDVTFHIIDGYVQINPKESITITTEGAEKKYDGIPLSNASYTYTDGVLVEGDVLTVEMNSSIVDAGVLANSVSSYTVMRGSLDVTDCYVFNPVVEGQLRILPRTIVVQTADSLKGYDGTPLTNPKYWIVGGDGFVSGQGFTPDFSLTSQTNPGVSFNVYNPIFQTGTNPDNYTLQNHFGTLEVVDHFKMQRSVYPVLCTEGSGGLYIYAAGGELPYAYAIEGGSYPVGGEFTTITGMSANITGLVEGTTYRVIMKDNRGDRDTMDFMMNIPMPLVSNGFTVQGTSCKGNDGKATFNVQGGKKFEFDVYNYIWSTGENNQTVSNLNVGEKYYVTATDYYGCTVVDSVVIGVDSILIFDNYSDGTGCSTEGSFAYDPLKYYPDAELKSTVRYSWGMPTVSPASAASQVTGMSGQTNASYFYTGHLKNNADVPVVLTYTVTPWNPVCEDNPTFTVTISLSNNSKTGENITLSAPNYYLCPDVTDTTLRVSLGGLNNLSTYQLHWNFNGISRTHALPRGTTSDTLKVTLPETACTGRYPIRLYIADSAGCTHHRVDTVLVGFTTWSIPMDPEIKVVSCSNEAIPPHEVPGQMPVVSDNCGRIIDYTMVTRVEGTDICNQYISHVYTFKDCQGNEADWTYTYHVLDTTAPVINVTLAATRADVANCKFFIPDFYDTVMNNTLDNCVHDYPIEYEQLPFAGQQISENTIVNITVTDYCGNSRTIQVPVYIDEPVHVAATEYNSFCYDKSDGEIKGVVSGGVAPYTVFWNCAGQNGAVQKDAAGDFAFTDLPDGLYTIYAYSANGCYSVDTVTLSLQDYDEPIVVKANSTTRAYDGTPLTDPGYTVSGTLMTPNDVLTATVTGTITNVGSVVNHISDVKIMRDGITDVTCLYNLSSVDGQLTISKRNIVLKSATDSKNYDGTPLTNHTVTIASGSFPAGEGIESYDVIGTRTYVGSTENDFSYTLLSTTNPNNYNITRQYGILTVNKVSNTLVITASGASKIYDGTPLVSDAYTYNSEVLLPGDVLEAEVVGTRTDVGMDYNVIINYKIMRGTEDVTNCYTVGPRQMGTLRIEPRPITIKAGDLTVEYNGEQHTWEEIPSPRYTLISSSFAENQLLDLSTLQLSGAGTTTGDYPSYVLLSSVVIKDTVQNRTVNSNYTINLVNGNIRINDHTPPYQIVLIAPHDTVLYDGAPHTLSGYDTVVVNGDTSLWHRSSTLNVTLRNENNHLIPYKIAGLTSSVTKSNAGTYPLNITGTPRVIDESGVDMSASFGVTRVPGWLVIKPLPSLVINIKDTMRYNGTPFTSDYPSSKVHSTEGLGAYDAISAGEVTTNSAAMGTYLYGNAESTITTPFQTTGGIGNYTAVTYIVSQTIIRGNAMTVDCPHGTTGDRKAEKIYDGTPINTPAIVLNANVHDDALPTVRYYVNGSSVATTTPPSRTDVGEDQVHVEVVHPYYETVTCDYVLKVTPRPVTLTSANGTKEYDATDLTAHRVTIGGMGFAAGEDTASTSVTGVIRNVWENTTDSKNNYFTYTLNSNVDPNNYTFTVVYGTLKINPRPVTIKSEDASKQYDGTALTRPIANVVSTKGFLNGDTVTYNFTGTQTIPGMSPNTFTVNGFNVGSDATSQQTNYKITTQNGTLTVTEPETIYIKALCETIVYDGLHHTGTQFQVSLGATPCEEVPGSNGLQFYVYGHENILTITPTADIVNVGNTPNTFTYTVTFGSQVISSCYIDNTDVCNITVTPRPLKIIANETKMYDAQPLATAYNETAHITTEGLVSGDYLTAGVFTTGSDTVHTYHYYTAIHNDSTSNITTAFNTHNGIANYEVTYIANQTITPSNHRTLTCPSGSSITKVYDATPLHPTATVTGQYAGDVFKIEYSLDGITWSETEPSVTHVHETPLTVYVRASHHDYETALCEYTLKVTPRPITLKSKSAEKVYDSTPLVKHEMEAVGGSGWARTEEGATYTYTGTQTLVGTSANTWSYALNENTLATDYNITTQNGQLKVTESPNLIVTCPSGSDITKMYDAVSIQPQAVFSGTYAGDESGVVVEYSLDNATWSTTVPSITHVVQSIPHIYVRARHHDYKTATCEYSLTITPRPATISSHDSTKVYDGIVLQNTKITTSGFVTGEGVNNSDFASITHVGTTANSFQSTAQPGTDLNDYDTTMVFGTLTVTPSNLAEINCPGTTANPQVITKTYDGVALNPTAVAAGISGIDNTIAVEYSLNGTTWSSTVPSITHVGTQHVYVRTVNPDYIVKECEYDLTINCRTITLTSGSDSKMFDNTPLKKETVAVSGDGLAAGESFNYSNFASITNKGTQNNTFSYSAGAGTALTDYCVTVVNGTLTITPRTGVVVVVKEHSGEYDYDGTEKTVTGYDVISISDPLYHNTSFKYSGPVADSVAKGTDPGSYPMNILPTDYTNLDDNFDNVTFIVQDGQLTIYPELLVWEITPTDVVCFGENNGKVNIKVQGGKPNYTYSITGPATYNGSTTGIVTLTNLKPGTYNLTVTDALSYNKTGMFIINEPTKLTATITVPSTDADLCPNQANYPVSVLVAGGIPNIPAPAYHYQWSNDATPADADNTVVNKAGTTDCGHTYTVAVKATDANNCEVTATKDFTVVDETKPTFTRPADITLYKDDACDASTLPAATGEPTNVLDNCTAAPTVTYRDEAIVNDCEGSYHFNRVWRVVDNCGNVSVSDSVQLITVVDNIKPTFIRPADITLYKDDACNASTLPAATGEPTNVLDNCTAVPTVTYRDETVVNDCEGSYHFNRVWRVVDACGNVSISDSVQLITVVDNIKPTYDRPADYVAYKDASCDAATTTAEAGEPTNVLDNCTAAPVVSYRDEAIVNDCEGGYHFNRVWRVVDACGNVSISDSVQLITVVDTIRPIFTVPADLTICREADDSFIADPSVTGVPSAQTDNCTATATLVANTMYHDLDTLPLSNLVLRTIRRAWTVTDDCGNVTEKIQNIYINPRPVMDNPGDQVICRKELFAELTFTSPILDGTMTYEWTNDNTAIGLAATGDTKIPAFTAVNTTTGDLVANITVTPTYHNASLNCIGVPVTFTITVKPSAIDMADKTAYIRCNGDAFSITPTGVSIPAGTQYVWTVDANTNVTGQSDQTTPVNAPISQLLNNISSTLQTVTYHVTPMTDGCAGDMFDIVVEVEPTPVLTLDCPADIIRTLNFGDCTMKISPDELGTPTWAHSLGWTLISITNNAPADSIYPEGVNVVTWTMTDECGNTATCDQLVTIIFPACPDAVDYEGNVYHGIRIDCDCWTQRNLESNKYSDGADIPGVYNYYAVEYPDVDDNVNKFGRLYDGESAVRDGADNGYGHIQGICPAGWYLPTAEKYVALNAHGADALKSPMYWLDGGGSNTTEFTSLPAGYYDGSIDRYLNLMGEAYYWSTTLVGGTWTATASTMGLNCSELHTTNVRTGLGFSVRCIKEKE